MQFHLLNLIKFKTFHKVFSTLWTSAWRVHCFFYFSWLPSCILLFVKCRLLYNMKTIQDIPEYPFSNKMAIWNEFWKLMELSSHEILKTKQHMDCRLNIKCKTFVKFFMGAIYYLFKPGGSSPTQGILW